MLSSNKFYKSIVNKVTTLLTFSTDKYHIFLNFSINTPAVYIFYTNYLQCSILAYIAETRLSGFYQCDLFAAPQSTPITTLTKSGHKGGPSIGNCKKIFQGMVMYSSEGFAVKYSIITPKIRNMEVFSVLFKSFLGFPMMSFVVFII